MDDALMNEFSFHHSLAEAIRETVLNRLPTTGINFDLSLFAPQEFSQGDPWRDIEDLARDHEDCWVEFR